jgi:hypothetical protein
VVGVYGPSRAFVVRFATERLGIAAPN